MRIRQKILLLAVAALTFLVVGTIGVYYYAMAKVKNGLTYFHHQIVQEEGYVESLDIEYDDLELQLPFGLHTTNLKLDIITSGSNQHVLISTNSVGIQLNGVPSGALKVSARNINLASNSEDKPLLSNQYKIRNIEIRFVEYETYVSILKPEQSVRRVYSNLAQLLSQGEITGRVVMQGVVNFDFENGDVFAQRFNTQDNNGVSRIVLNLEDLKTVAPKFASRLSDGDLHLVANHPLRAPRMLQIRKETEEKSLGLRWANKDFPEDVYRHVLWSYLLTKEYGPEFANFITNSHELGSFNTVEEMAKDRQNNQVGINYAENEVPEGKLLDHIRSDPRIQF